METLKFNPRHLVNRGFWLFQVIHVIRGKLNTGTPHPLSLEWMLPLGLRAEDIEFGVNISTGNPVTTLSRKCSDSFEFISIIYTEVFMLFSLLREQ